MKILVTNGGTKVRLDDVRYIGNSSRGIYGAKIANKLSILNIDGVCCGNDVLCFSEVEASKNVYDHIKIKTFDDYFSYLDVKNLITEFNPDVIISAAAVSDFVCDKVDGKISSGDEVVIKLRKAEKVISSFRDLAPNAYIVGFKLLYDATSSQIEEVVLRFMERDRLDAVVFNDLKKLRENDPTRYFYNRRGSVVFCDWYPEVEKLCESIVRNAARRDVQ